jgi:predicted RNA-binding protein YlqC (UPF0109 family)
MAEAHGDQAAQGEALVEATLAFIGRSLATDPDTVSISSSQGERGLTLRLEVDQADLGRFIGRSGRTARAIRAVVRAGATKAGVHVFVEIAGRGEAAPAEPAPIKPAPAAE